MAPKYTFIYFPAMARGEICRLLFAQAGIEYEDKRIELQQWPEWKPKTPFGELPVMTIDDKMYGQTVAIARYLAAEGGLDGKDNLERLAADQIVLTVVDLFDAAVKVKFSPNQEAKDRCYKELSTEALPRVLPRLEMILGEQEWFTGNLTWADLMFYDVMERVKGIGGIEDPYSGHPKLKALADRVANLPKIAHWIATRPKTDF